MIFRLISVELQRYLREIKAYYPDHIVGLVVTFVFFYGFFVGFSGNIGNEYMYIGFFYWFFASTVISEGSISISYEKQVGTFEQLYLKPTSLLLILTIRTVIWMFIGFIKTLILFPIILLALDINFIISIQVLPIFIITMIGLYGFGVFLSSLTLLYTKTASFESIISYLFLFFTGAIIPLSQLPTQIGDLSKFLPLTLGIEMSKNAIKFNEIVPRELLLLSINSFIYLLLGIVFYKFVISKGKKSGFSSKY